MNRPSSLAALRLEFQGCKACPLWMLGAQTVFGEGNPHPRIDPKRSIAEMRGRVIERPGGPAWLATVHPSCLLRVPARMHSLAYQGFVADLGLARPFAILPAGAAGPAAGGGRPLP